MCLVKSRVLDSRRCGCRRVYVRCGLGLLGKAITVVARDVQEIICPFRF